MDKSAYNILIVEDDKMMRDLLTDRLSREKIFNIFLAKDGREGLYSASINNPDLILLDIRMPVMDGIEMFKELRKVDKFKNVPVIFLTNYDTNESVLSEISEGRPAFYLIKANISMDEMVRKVKESLHI
jgi:DNA-binding response OmpR family regulator